jgi:hypothetical protein
MKGAWMAAGIVAATVALAASEPGAPVDGPDLTGWIVDAQTGKPPPVYAVVHVTWELRAASDRPKADGRTRRVVKEINSVVGGRYHIIDWKQYVDTKGWKLVPGADPIVRIYAPGYRRLMVENTTAAKGGKPQPVNAPDAKEWKWVGESTAHALAPLPATPDALADELAVWKRDIGSDLAATPARDRDAAIHERGKLLLLFDELCGKLHAPPAGLCYTQDSPVGRYVAQAKTERAQYLVVEEPSGKVMKYRKEAAPGSLNTMSRTHTATPQDAVPGMGFSSELPKQK